MVLLNTITVRCNGLFILAKATASFERLEGPLAFVGTKAMPILARAVICSSCSMTLAEFHTHTISNDPQCM